MASEKTTKALYAAKRFVRQGNSLVLLRPSISRRDHEKRPGFLTTKADESWPCIEIERAGEIAENAQGHDILWIDEPFMLVEDPRGELFSAVEEVLSFATVMISTISATSERLPINHSVSSLIAVADKIVDCYGDCDCCGSYNAATRSWHLSGPKEQAVKVGGEDEYEPRCPSCWNDGIRDSKRVSRV